MLSLFIHGHRRPKFAELQKLKAQVVTEIRSNQQLEQDLHSMDIKIGLLVRNKITLQVCIASTYRMHALTASQ